MKVVSANRNDPCPCGSGKKYKNCCARKQSTGAHPSRRSQVPAYILVLVLAGAAMAGYRVWTRPAPTPPPPFVPPAPPAGTAAAPMAAPMTTPDAATGLYPQPPGPVPEGKVWSPEHGHWHNVVSSGPDGQPQQTTLHPQPPGPVPEGKVWSPEHGHWHNAPGTALALQQSLPTRMLPPYNGAMAKKLQETYRPYRLPTSAALQSVLPPTPLP